MAKKKISEDEIKRQKWSDKKIDDFMRENGEINKINIERFKEWYCHEYQVERLLYINNKIFRYKEKTSIEQIVAAGGVIIPYKQGVENVTINQRVARLEDIVTGLHGNQNSMQKQMDGMQVQINGMQVQMDGMQVQMDGMQKQMDGMQVQINGMQKQMDGMQVQINEIKVTLNIVIDKIDKLTDLFMEHIKNHN